VQSRIQMTACKNWVWEKQLVLWGIGLFESHILTKQECFVKPCKHIFEELTL